MKEPYIIVTAPSLGVLAKKKDTKRFVQKFTVLSVESLVSLIAKKIKP
jgi:hypothetical protein